jgi:hypothetical protein
MSGTPKVVEIINRIFDNREFIFEQPSLPEGIPKWNIHFMHVQAMQTVQVVKEEGKTKEIPGKVTVSGYVIVSMYDPEPTDEQMAVSREIHVIQKVGITERQTVLELKGILAHRWAGNCYEFASMDASASQAKEKPDGHKD